MSNSAIHHLQITGLRGCAPFPSLNLLGSDCVQRGARQVLLKFWEAWLHGWGAPWSIGYEMIVVKDSACANTHRCHEGVRLRFVSAA